MDRNTKDRLKGLYDRNSRMFDGTAKLEAANFGAVSSKDTAITGKGGKVTDLKSSEPDIPKLSAVSEFSLASAKTASATAVKASPESCYPQAYIATCTCLPPNDSIKLGYDMCYDACTDKISTLGNCPSGGIGIGWEKFTAGVKKLWEDVKTVFSNLPELAKTLWKDLMTVITNPWQLVKILPQAIWDAIKYVFGNIWDAMIWIKDVILGNDKECEGKKYNSEKYCCDGNRPLSRTEIKDLSDCKKRNQYRKDPAVTGCIITWNDKFRGFGHNDNPTGGENTTFYWTCQAHNKCYADCARKTKDVPTSNDAGHRSYCDKNLSDNLNSVCADAGNLQTKCLDNANKYHQIIAKQNGLKSHDTAQKNNCTCCAKGQK